MPPSKPFTERVSEVEEVQRAQGRRIDDHDTALVGLVDSLKDLIARFDRLEKKATVVFAVWLATTQGGDVATAVAKALSGT